jgi:hypothetical protein
MHELRRPLVFAAALSTALAPTACASAGPWGHARDYVPLTGEQQACDGARDYDPVMAAREPEEWSREPVQLFGVVVRRGEAADGSSVLELSVRRLEPRNLCEGPAADSCRVTVTEHEFGSVRAHVKLRPDDDQGELSVGTGSLVRVAGRLSVKGEAGATIAAAFYRHWPRGYFVTTAARKHMRR